MTLHLCAFAALLSAAPDGPRPDLSDAHGVTGPEPAPPAPTPLWRDERTWAVAFVAVAVTAAVLAGRRTARRDVAEPPDVWAEARLDRLARFQAGSPPSAHELAELLREFLHRRYRIAARGKTTAELMRLVRKSVPDQAVGWQTILERCDVARFANVDFSTPEWSDAIRQCRRLIAETLPVGETADAAGTGSDGEKA
jgi:hypothetical protein